MKIGIIGVGHIGKALALKLAQSGHDVVVANSTGPENIDPAVLATGAVAVMAQQAVQDKDVIILSVPLNRIPEIAPLFETVSQEATVIDTSNYYPARDNRIESLEAGQVESLWVVQQLGRPMAKAWNAIGSHSLAVNRKPYGSPNRIAIPIAADRAIDRDVTRKLINDTGFDAFYTGPLADSWRQQPGGPAYCTDLTSAEIQVVINTAEKDRLP
jgi:predicted dinucleotide-binding enzyme